MHAPNDGLGLAVRVHVSRVHQVVSPVQESFHHVPALFGVSAAAERHSSQQGNRPFLWRRSHSSATCRRCQVHCCVLKIITFYERDTSSVYDTVHVQEGGSLIQSQWSRGSFYLKWQRTEPHSGRATLEINPNWAILYEGKKSLLTHQLEVVSQRV